MAFYVDPKSMLLLVNIRLHVAGLLMNVRVSWWTDHTGIWVRLFSVPSPLTSVGMFAQNTCDWFRGGASHCHFLWSPRSRNIRDRLVYYSQREEWRHIAVYFSYLWARHAVISLLASSCFRSFLFLSMHLLKIFSSEPFPQLPASLSKQSLWLAE